MTYRIGVLLSVLRPQNPSILLTAAVLFAACQPQEELNSPEDIELAEEVYTECVEDEIGIEVERVDISSTGDIDVQFGAGTTREQEELAIEICEARIAGYLEPGLPRFFGEPENLGRPGTVEELQALVDAAVDLGFSGTALVIYKGESQLATGVGVADREVGTRPSLDTAFDTGSIAKEVTAAAIFRIEAEGLIAREGRIAEYLEVPPVWQEVTIQQTLEHRAGFDTYHDTLGDFEPMTRDEALERIFATEPLFEPGSRESYSNSGFTVLAAIIEEVTGETFAAVARSRVFDPAGLTRTGYYGDGLWSDGDVAIGYGVATEGERNDPSAWGPPTWALIGNGGLVSTTNDLVRLARAFDTGEIFDPTTHEAFQEDYLALSAGRIEGAVVYGYAGGSDYGFSSAVIHAPADESYIVVLSNVWSAVPAEVLAVPLLQVSYGAVVEPL